MSKSHNTSHPEAHAAPRRYQVLLPLPLAGAYDYSAAPDAKILLGSFVYVPLGGRMATGVVWAEGDENSVDAARLKDIESVLDAPPLPESVCRFVEWVADYTVSPLGSVLRMAMSAPQALSPPAPRVAFALAENPPMRPPSGT